MSAMMTFRTDARHQNGRFIFVGETVVIPGQDEAVEQSWRSTVDALVAGWHATRADVEALLRQAGASLSQGAGAVRQWLRGESAPASRETALPLDLSTLPATPENEERRALENVVLSAIRTHFPVDTGQTWYHTLGSRFHLGDHRAAMDLNVSTGGNTDEDLPVTVVADGTIESIGLDYGTVRVRHTSQVNGKEKTWYTTYMHMRLVATDRKDGEQVIYEARDKDGNVIATLNEGQELNAGETVGGIAGRGLNAAGVRDDHAFSAHLHFEAEDDAGNPIHSGNLLAEMGIQTYALSGDYIPHPVTSELTNQIFLTWNDDVDEWVEETHHIIFDQEAANTGHSNVWVAWHDDPEQRRRVVWDKDANVLARWDGEKNAFYKKDNRREIWDSLKKTWLSE